MSIEHEKKQGIQESSITVEPNERNPAMHDTIILTLLALSLVFLGGISNRRHAGMLEQLNRLTQQVTHLLEITESRPEVSSQKRRTLATVIFNDPNCPKPPDEAIY